MTKDALSTRQHECLLLIVGHTIMHGYPPTKPEIGASMGIASVNGVNDHLRALERKRFISRTSQHRAIKVLRLPGVVA